MRLGSLGEKKTDLGGKEENFLSFLLFLSFRDEGLADWEVK